MAENEDCHPTPAQIVEVIIEDFKVRGPVFQLMTGLIAQGIYDGLKLAFQKRPNSDPDLPLKD